MFPHLDMIEYGNIEQVLQAGLIMAVEISVFEDPGRFLPVQIEVMLQDDLVLGQRAGLVGAQDIHRAEVLDRVEALDDDPLARHRDGALGQIDGHDHRQHLGCQPDRDGEREHQRLQPVALGQAVDDEDARHHDRHEADHQPGKAGDPLVEAGRRALPYQHPGELAEIGPGAGLNDDSGGRRRSAHCCP